MSRAARKSSVPRPPFPPFLPAEITEALLDYWTATDGSAAEITGDTVKLTSRPARTFAARTSGHADTFRA
ncbi:hypothetical protein [Streptomyces sp. BE230]|uniref:hypothetical protein n=1 Tax=Streptomyces sp. BE230 TaxID=3002526 RepID=UPI002ED0EBA7|nr:hypothetical protein [Streptomyces sp. BE230]